MNNTDHRTEELFTIYSFSAIWLYTYLLWIIDKKNDKKEKRNIL